MFIGIDPGLSGAIAFLYDDGNAEVEDMPVVRITINNNKRRHELDLPKLEYLLRRPEVQELKLAVLEKVHGMPGMGGAAMFSFGRSYGQIEAILSLLRLPFTTVRPQAWKKTMLTGTAKDKGSALQTARRMFPALTDRLARKSDDGRAEALLMAEYIRRLHGVSNAAWRKS